MAGREGGAVAQVDDPLAGLDASAQLGGVGPLGRAQIGRGGAGGIGRSHVGVVGRPRAEPGQQVTDVGLLVLRQHRVGLPLAADRRGRRVGLRGGAEGAEAVCREDLGVVRQKVGQPVRRGVLVADQVVRVFGAEQIGAAGGAEEQRAAGEDAHLSAGAACGVQVAQCVGEVGEGVARGGKHGEAHAVTDLDDVAVADLGPLEGDLVGAVDQVGRAGGPRESETASDVVVVDVGLEDVGQAHVVLGQQIEDPVDVALRVDHERDLAVVDQVAAVAQGRGLDRDDCQVIREGALGHDAQPFLIGRPDRIQAPVPPATLTASKPWATRTSVIAALRLPLAQMTCSTVERSSSSSCPVR